VATSRVCSIPGCGKPHEAHGYCRTHYRRWKARGDAEYVHNMGKIGPCSVFGCGGTIRYLGLCGQHYDQKRMAKVQDSLPLCSVGDCGKKVRTKGLCSAHYQRWKAHGDPLAGRTAKGSPLKWLKEHVDFDGTECLTWPFARFPDGSGHATHEGRHIRASRLMCLLAHGEPPSDIHEAAHRCGKGHEACVNPNHLRWATPSENNQDKLLHGTMLRGELHPSSVLSESDVRTIRRLRGVVPQDELADRFGVGKAHICGIQLENEWAWLD
jgi:hypothetical protein